MDKLAKRYLITGAIGIASMLAALTFVLVNASEKVGRADSAVKPAPRPAPVRSVSRPAPEKAAGMP